MNELYMIPFKLEAPVIYEKANYRHYLKSFYIFDIICLSICAAGEGLIYHNTTALISPQFSPDPLANRCTMWQHMQIMLSN